MGLFFLDEIEVIDGILPTDGNDKIVLISVFVNGDLVELILPFSAERIYILRFF